MKSLFVCFFTKQITGWRRRLCSLWRHSTQISRSVLAPTVCGKFEQTQVKLEFFPFMTRTLLVHRLVWLVFITIELFRRFNFCLFCFSKFFFNVLHSYMMSLVFVANTSCVLLWRSRQEVIVTLGLLLFFAKMVGSLNTVVSSSFRCESSRFADNEWWTESVSVCVCVFTSWEARFRASFLNASREPDSRFDAADRQQLCIPTVSALLLPEIRQQGGTPKML